VTYKIARDGQEFGPYSLADVQRYVGTGNILMTDFALAEGATEWIPVAQVVGTIAVAPPVAPMAYAAAQGMQFPDPPNLHWALVLVLGIVTCGLFVYAWDIVQALFVKRIQPNSKALIYYIAGVGMLLLSVILTVAKLNTTGASLLNIVGAVLVLIGRFNLRSSLEEHYNVVDPVGLSLSGVMTFFFGPFYFQYHFNRINEIKRAYRLQNPY
jgi:hypothetical protein